MSTDEKPLLGHNVPEGSFYRMKFRCMNCGHSQEEEIPRGEGVRALVGVGGGIRWGGGSGMPTTVVLCRNCRCDSLVKST